MATNSNSCASAAEGRERTFSPQVLCHQSCYVDVAHGRLEGEAHITTLDQLQYGGARQTQTQTHT